MELTHRGLIWPFVTNPMPGACDHLVDFRSVSAFEDVLSVSIEIRIILRIQKVVGLVVSYQCLNVAHDIARTFLRMSWEATKSGFRK